MSNSSIGARFRNARELKGMTAKELSKASGIPETTIYRIETGEVSNPKLSSIIPLLKALEASADELLMGRRGTGLSGLLEDQFTTINKWPSEDQYHLTKVLEKLIMASMLDEVMFVRNNPTLIDSYAKGLHDREMEFEEMLKEELEQRHNERLYQEHLEATGQS